MKACAGWVSKGGDEAPQRLESRLSYLKVEYIEISLAHCANHSNFIGLRNDEVRNTLKRYTLQAQTQKDTHTPKACGSGNLATQKKSCILLLVLDISKGQHSDFKSQFESLTSCKHTASKHREDGCKIAPSNNCPNFITPLRTLHLIVIVILTKSLFPPSSISKLFSSLSSCVCVSYPAGLVTDEADEQGGQFGAPHLWRGGI